MWAPEGRSVAREIPLPASAGYQAAPDPARPADKAWVKARRTDPAVVLLDSRSPEEFNGAVAGPEVARPGRNPGAVDVDWTRHLTSTEPRQLRGAAELALPYREAGVTPDREVVVCSRTGARGSHAYFVLRLLGYPSVRLYDGSFIERAADPSLPVAPSADPDDRGRP